MPLPLASDISACAHEIVVTAKRKNALNTLTKRLVRQQVESQLGLEEGSLSKEKRYRDAVSDAITAATADSKSEAEGDEEEGRGETKKRKRQDKRGGGISKTELTPSAKDRAAATKPNKATKSRPEYQSDSQLEKRPKVELVSPSSPSEHTGDIDDEPAGENEAVLETKSESELSVLIDEPPKKKRAKKSSIQETSSKEKKKEKDPNEKGSKRASGSAGEDRNEATIKRLKSFVAACGIRKVWSKEFRSMEKPSQQIAHLKKTLADLGMTGRYSIERAKAIREKRELASELADVQSFEKAIVGSSKRRSKPVAAQKREQSPDQDSNPKGGSESESDDGDKVQAKRRPKNALASIEAFLGDDSE